MEPRAAIVYAFTTRKLAGRAKKALAKEGGIKPRRVGVKNKKKTQTHRKTKKKTKKTPKPVVPSPRGRPVAVEKKARRNW